MELVQGKIVINIEGMRIEKMLASNEAKRLHEALESRDLPTFTFGQEELNK